MNFDLSEDQKMLKSTADRLFAEAPEDLWSQMAELGLLALPFAEASGGLGMGATELMVVAEAAGGAEGAAGYGQSIVMAGRVLEESEASKAELLAKVIAGEARLALADDGVVDLVGGRARGRFRNVGFADQADWLVAATDDLAILVPRTATSVEPYRLIDGTPAGDVVFDTPEVRLLARGDPAASMREKARQQGIVWRSAEAVGLMQSVLDATLEHLRTRHQFGKSLANFQALKHKAAEMLVAVEQARSMALLAALSAAEPDDVTRRKAFSQVRRVMALSCRLVAQASVQMHGGIGVTEEHPVGRAFRRLTLIDLEMSAS